MSGNERILARRHERHGAASIRALGGKPEADYRAQRLMVKGQAQPFAAPYLNVDFATTSLQRMRGVSDALAMRLRFSDQALHRSLLPEHSFARIVFDILEQIRCESLTPSSLPGARQNMDHAFLCWCMEARYSPFVESSLGILLYTLIHMVRARLVKNDDDEEVAALIEATRANLGPLIGVPFYQLSSSRFDQQAYSEHALQIASLLAELSGEEGQTLSEPAAKRRQLMALPPDWERQQVPDEVDFGNPVAKVAAGDDLDQLSTAGGYHIFTTDYDSVSDAASLYRNVLLTQARTTLDQMVAAQAVSVARLALRLQKLFAADIVDDWRFGQEEGFLDARRLSQLVSNPAYRQVFYHDLVKPRCDVAVTFLIDNSGSMKTQRFEAVAVLVDTFARALELTGAKCEILGFSTGGWNGGRVLRQWRKQGADENPGRLNETSHLIYKDADATWRKSRHSIAALMKTNHYREGVDGEALIWASRRLLARPENKRFLVMISDGSPMDAATDNANPDNFLLDHLCSVARHIETRTPINLGCIGIDLDTSFFIQNSVAADLKGTLGNQTYQVLHELFG